MIYKDSFDRFPFASGCCLRLSLPRAILAYFPKLPGEFLSGYMVFNTKSIHMAKAPKICFARVRGMPKTHSGGLRLKHDMQRFFRQFPICLYLLYKYDIQRFFS